MGDLSDRMREQAERNPGRWDAPTRRSDRSDDNDRDVIKRLKARFLSSGSKMTFGDWLESIAVPVEKSK